MGQELRFRFLPLRGQPSTAALGTLVLFLGDGVVTEVPCYGVSQWDDYRYVPLLWWLNAEGTVEPWRLVGRPNGAYGIYYLRSPRNRLVAVELPFRHVHFSPEKTTEPLYTLMPTKRDQDPLLVTAIDENTIWSGDQPYAIYHFTKFHVVVGPL